MFMFMQYTDMISVCEYLHYSIHLPIQHIISCEYSSVNASHVLTNDVIHPGLIDWGVVYYRLLLPTDEMYVSNY